MAQQDPEYLGYHPGAELIFAIVCPLGTPYKRVAEALGNYLSQFGYKTEPIQVSDYFDDLLQKLGSELKLEGNDARAIAHHKIAAGNQIRQLAKKKTTSWLLLRPEVLRTRGARQSGRLGKGRTSSAAYPVTTRHT